MNIVNVMLWMKRNAYEDSTVRKTAKLLRHLQRNCNIKEPEQIKTYVANKNVSNGHKENLIEAYAIYMRSENLTWNQPFYDRYDKKRRPPKEEKIDFLINNARFEMKLKYPLSATASRFFAPSISLAPIAMELSWQLSAGAFVTL
jgi:hypothetical protein